MDVQSAPTATDSRPKTAAKEFQPTFLGRGCAVSTGARALYAKLKDWYWVSRKKGRDYVFPLQRDLAYELRVSRRTIQLWLAELVRAGKIRSVRKMSGNNYYFVDPHEAAIAPAEAQPIAPAEAQPIAPAEAQPIAPAEAQPIAPAEAQPIAPAEAQPIAPAEAQPIAPAEAQPIAPAEAQPIAPAEAQPIAPAEAQFPLLGFKHNNNPSGRSNNSAAAEVELFLPIEVQQAAARLSDLGFSRPLAERYAAKDYRLALAACDFVTHKLKKGDRKARNVGFLRGILHRPEEYDFQLRDGNWHQPADGPAGARGVAAGVERWRAMTRDEQRGVWAKVRRNRPDAVHDEDDVPFPVMHDHLLLCYRFLAQKED